MNKSKKTTKVENNRIQQINKEMDSINASMDTGEISRLFKRKAERIGLKELETDKMTLQASVTTSGIPGGKNISIPEFPKGEDAGKGGRIRQRVENKQIKEIRSKVERLLADAEINRMSRVFKHTIAQRLDLKEFNEGGLILKAPVAMGGGGGGGSGGGGDTPYSYGNIYTYNFW